SVFAPAFPSIYAVFNTEKLAFSFGFNPVGGGGGATYEEGLSMIEMPISDLVPLLASQGALGYRLDTRFVGSSIFFGFQGNVSYKINDMISVSAGARYVTASNKYEGHLKDIQLNMGGTWLPASTVFTNIATQLSGIVAIPTATAALVTTFGTNTLSEIPDQYLPAASKAGIQAGLAAIGVPAANIPLMSLNQIRGTITAATPTLNGQIAQASATAVVMGNQAADVVQSGSGITPVIGVNLSLTDKLNVGIKYEFKTKLEVTNATAADFTTGFDPETGAPVTMFPDGAVIINDMPALLAVGIEFRPLDKLLLTGSFNYYFDQAVDYDGSADKDIDMIDKNFTEFALGVEYGLTEKLRASAGWLGTFSGVNLNYQDELSYSLNTNSFGAGFGFRISPMVDINLGGMYTMYKEGTKTYNHIMTGTILTKSVTEKFNKDAWVIAVGVDLNF
ncbi:MAG: outer membrane protein transport protein, partial [Bacteroidales bacterium]|nr:outer membrane protein transport protein [Bacteroidales bacterium]